MLLASTVGARLFATQPSSSPAAGAKPAAAATQSKPAAPAAQASKPAAASAAPTSGKRAGSKLERRSKPEIKKRDSDKAGPKSGGKLVATGRITAVVGAVVDVQFDKVSGTD